MLLRNIQHNKDWNPVVYIQTMPVIQLLRNIQHNKDWNSPAHEVPWNMARLLRNIQHNKDWNQTSHTGGMELLGYWETSSTIRIETDSAMRSKVDPHATEKHPAQ